MNAAYEKLLAQQEEDRARQQAANMLAGVQRNRPDALGNRVASVEPIAAPAPAPVQTGSMFSAATSAPLAPMTGRPATGFGQGMLSGQPIQPLEQQRQLTLGGALPPHIQAQLIDNGGASPTTPPVAPPGPIGVGETADYYISNPAELGYKKVAYNKQGQLVGYGGDAEVGGSVIDIEDKTVYGDGRRNHPLWGMTSAEHPDTLKHRTNEEWGINTRPEYDGDAYLPENPADTAENVQLWHRYYRNNPELVQHLSLNEQQDFLYLQHLTGNLTREEYKDASYALRNEHGLDRHYSMPGRDSHRFEYQWIPGKSELYEGKNAYDAFIDTHDIVGGYYDQNNLPGGSFFEDEIAGNPVIRAVAAYYTGGWSEAALAAKKGIEGETLHGSDYLAIVTPMIPGNLIPDALRKVGLDAAADTLQSQNLGGSMVRGVTRDIVTQAIVDGKLDIQDAIEAGLINVGVDVAGDLFKDAADTNDGALEEGVDTVDGRPMTGGKGGDIERLTNTSDLYGLLGENGLLSKLGIDLDYMPTDVIGDVLDGLGIGGRPYQDLRYDERFFDMTTPRGDVQMQGIWENNPFAHTGSTFSMPNTGGPPKASVPSTDSIITPREDAEVNEFEEIIIDPTESSIPGDDVPVIDGDPVYDSEWVDWRDKFEVEVTPPASDDDEVAAVEDDKRPRGGFNRDNLPEDWGGDNDPNTGETPGDDEVSEKEEEEVPSGGGGGGGEPAPEGGGAAFSLSDNEPYDLFDYFRIDQPKAARLRKHVSALAKAIARQEITG